MKSVSKSKNKSKNKKKNSIFNIKKKKKVDSKGFTLIEVLAMIAILSIIISIVVYFAIDLVGNAKRKSYQVTISNIEQEVRDYALEEITEMSWIPISSGYEYQCITVQDLIDAGYFKGDVLNSYVNEDRKVLASDYIYIEKDSNNKTIRKNILAVGQYEFLASECEYVPLNGRVTIIVSPENTWSKEKNIDITYKVNNFESGLTYGYGYGEDAGNDMISISSGMDSAEKHVNFDVSDNVFIHAEIKKGEELVASNNALISLIDNNAPDATISSTNNIAPSQTVNIVMNDSESGIDRYYFGQSENPDDVLFTDGQGKNSLTINPNVNKSGTWYLIVYDVVENVTKKEVQFYQTNLSINNGSVNPSVILTMEGNQFTVPNGIANEGYSFIGWYTSSSFDGSKVTVHKPTSNSTLYALMGTVSVADTTAPTISFSYDGNGDIWGNYAMSDITVTDDNSGVDDSSLKMVYSTSNSMVNFSSSATSSGTGIDLVFNKIYSFTNGAFVASEAGNGYYYLHAYACDNAGNCSSKTSQKFQLDNTPPVASMVPNSGASSTLGIKLNMEDSLSGISQYCFATTKGSGCENGNNSKNIEKTFNVSNGGTWYLTVSDAAGHSTEVSKIVYKTEFTIQNGSISTSALLVAEGNSLVLPTPTMNSGYEFDGWYDGSKYVGMGGSTYTPTSSTTLVGYSSSNTTEEDTTKPIISVSPNGTTRYKISETSTITAVDSSGIKTLKYAVNQSSSYNFNGGVNGTSISSGDSYTFSGKTGTYYLHVYAEDYNDNYSEFHSNPYYLDNISPSVSMESSNNVSSSQTVDLYMSDSYSGIASYSWGSGSFTSTSISGYPSSTSATKTVSSPGTYSFYATDGAGNSSVIDSLTFYKTSLYVNGTQMTYIITESGNSFNVPSVGIPSGYTLLGWENSSGVQVADVGGSYTPSSSTSLYAILEKEIIDNSPPSISFDPDGTNGWVSSESSVISAYDSSGIQILKYGYNQNSSYDFNGGMYGASISSGKSHTFSGTTGTYYLHAYACDNNDNCTTEHSSPFLIDATEPTVDISSTSNASDTQTVTLTVGDAHSGLASYSWGLLSPSSTSISGKSQTITETVGTAGTFTLTATDAVGNTNSTSATFYMTTLMVAGSTDQSIITMSGDSFLLPSVSKSGYEFKGWSTNDSATSVSYSAGSSYTVTSSTYLYAVLEKKVADTTGPTIRFSPDGCDWTNENVSSTITATDTSGISVLKYYPIADANYNFDGTTSGSTISSGSSHTFSRKTGTYYIYAYACDNLGNCTTERSDAFYLDSSYPSLSITNPYNGSNWYNKASLDAGDDYTLTIDASDVGSGIDYYQYKYSGTNDSFVTISGCSGTTCETPEFTNEVDDETVSVKVCDRAGNCSISSTKIYIDVTPPTVDCNSSGAWVIQTIDDDYNCTIASLNKSPAPYAGLSMNRSLTRGTCSASYTVKNCDSGTEWAECDEIFDISDNIGIGSTTCGTKLTSDTGDTSSNMWRATYCNCIYGSCKATLTYYVYDRAGNKTENSFVYSHKYEDASSFPTNYPNYCP